ncbi:MAG: CNT family concentrative nucleoside transporter [Halioglobus sp.]|jgi:CNT family concentrative nucleoside transporter
MTENAISLFGIAILIGIAVLFSTNRRAINFRIVASALALQALIALIVLRVPAGQRIIQSLSSGVQAFVDYSGAGIKMVFGPLSDTSTGIVFAINVLPIIIFFSALMAVLYHIGIMPIIVRAVGGGLQRLLGTEKVESLNAAANIFVSQTESPLVIKPYLKGLTDAQLFAIVVSGMASVAGSVLAAYAQMGVRIDYLLAAMFMAAPGGLLMAKIIMPDDPDAEEQALQVIEPNSEDSERGNVILAAANGAADGLRLAVNIGAMLIAFVSLIALFNGIVGGIGGALGFDGLTLEGILGTIFAPIMFALSIPWSEAQIAGSLFGEKLILNEFVAFFHLGEVVTTLSPRTEMIATISLCGFANLSSIAIQLGGLGSLIPEKRQLISSFGLRAVAAGSLANLMSAALAGLLFA